MLIIKGSQSPNGQRTLDRISESPVISLGDYDVDLLFERHGGCDESLAGVESMMNKIEADRIKPHTVGDEVATRSDEHNRLSLSLLMRQEDRGYAVGGSTFEESLDGTTGPDCTLNSDHLPSTSVRNIAHVAAGNFDLQQD